jgi:hypothetical protein
VLGLLMLVPDVCRADPVKGEATLTAEKGYARLVLTLGDDVDSDVTVAGSILVIHFKRPVDIAVDQLSDAVPDYVSAARRDPDGSAIRLALARKVTVNSMVAGERLFVDLLPDGWKGMPPGLPQEVVRELAERARAAERALRQQRAVAEAKKQPPVRVRASVQPTFIRYVFELPDRTGVSSSLNEHRFSLVFDRALNFDLSDARLAAPAYVGRIDQKAGEKTSAVDMTLIGDVDVHSFRDEKNYVVDVGFRPAERPSAVPVAPAKSSDAPEGAKASQIPHESDAAQSLPNVHTSLVTVPVAPLDDAPLRGVGTASQAVATPAIVTDTRAAVQPSRQTLAAGPAPDSAAAKPSSTPSATSAQAAGIAASAAKTAQVSAAVTVQRGSDGWNVAFSFSTFAPAALFRRADALWFVVDSDQPIDLEPIRRDAGAVVGDVKRIVLPHAQAIRMQLAHPELVSLAGETGNNGGAGGTWIVTLADTLETASQPLGTTRNVADVRHASITIPLTGLGHLHRITDPGAGDTLMVVTALPPVRGFIRRQEFVEFSVLESIQGVTVRPRADDVEAKMAPDSVTLTRPGGLTLSAATVRPERASASVAPIFDDSEWRRNRAARFTDRLDSLVEAEAKASDAGGKAAARLALARFYMAWEMYPEAKGVLDLALADAKPGTEDPIVLIVHSVAASLMNKPALALKDLANPAIGANYNSQLWKALAYAKQHKWAAAREAFKNAEFAVTTLPLELQRAMMMEAMRAALEVKDLAGAAARSDDLDAIGIPATLTPDITLLRGRLAEGLGRDRDALAAYRAAASSPNRMAAAEGELREIMLRQKRHEIDPADALQRLETLAVTWRGDDIEVQTLQLLTQLYTDAGRYRDALAAARTATRLQPNSDAARQAQDDASALFAKLFLTDKGDSLPPIDALATFYDYRELTPIGRRGDEMIRHLADRLIGVDLLAQAAELLQYQIDHRLEGAARAQVAARLAMVYLMNHKPDRAIAALQATRIADLAGELRKQRLLLEARAQSDVGRRDLALEMISNMSGREAIRLRSDIYWAARRWRESAEQIELYYGDRWRDFKPLNRIEKGDVIRAVIGYALAEDSLGLARFREKYAPLMTGKEDRAAFDVASKPATATSADFVSIARMAGSVDTLDGFLRDMQARFPDTITKAALPTVDTGVADPTPTGALPKIVGTRQADAVSR